MQIPEILQGTPAISFREWYGANQLQYMTGRPKEVHTFLSAPFDPAEIPEMFEGWEYNPDEGQYENGLVAVDTDEDLIYAKTEWLGFLPWKTRDDFIRDFNRAKTGVTLIWKGGEK